MKNIIFIAPPAAGKGTMSSLLKAKYGYMHISTGDLLRDAKNQDNELGRKLVTMLSSGKLVPDEIVLELLEKSLDNRDKDTPFILDGYPRNLSQVDSLLNLFKKDNTDKVLNNVQTNSLTETRDSIFKKIWNKIKNLFKK